MTIKTDGVRVKTRELIVSQQLESVRSQVVKCEIELDFLVHTHEKVYENELIENKAETLKKLSENIAETNDTLVFLEEKRSYLEDINRSSALKFSKSAECKMRRIIISDLIDEVRAIVINSNIEIDFLSKTKKKIEEGDIKLMKPRCLDNDIGNLSKQIPFLVERLNYLKGLRESNKADRIALSLEYKNSRSAEC